MIVFVLGPLAKAAIAPFDVTTLTGGIGFVGDCLAGANGGNDSTGDNELSVLVSVDISISGSMTSETA